MWCSWPSCLLWSLLLRDRLWGAVLLPTRQEHLCERATLQNIEEDWLLLFARRRLVEDLESTERDQIKPDRSFCATKQPNTPDVAAGQWAVPARSPTRRQGAVFESLKFEYGKFTREMRTAYARRAGQAQQVDHN